MRRLAIVLAMVLLAVTGLSAQDWSLTPAYGSANLTNGFTPDPHRVDLTAGGSINLSSMGYSGYVANAPDYDLYYTAGGSWPLVIRAESSGDTVLLVNAPDGNWYFNDDYAGVDPAIVFDSPQSGLYNIWVG
ncbi:MAG: peptidase S1, partial [bacterium]